MILCSPPDWQDSCRSVAPARRSRSSPRLVENELDTSVPALIALHKVLEGKYLVFHGIVLDNDDTNLIQPFWLDVEDLQCGWPEVHPLRGRHKYDTERRRRFPKECKDIHLPNNGTFDESCPRGSEQAEDPAQAEVTEGECHGRSWSLAANTASEHCQLRAAIEVLVPYTSASTVAVSSLGNSVRVMAFRSVMVLVFPSQRGSRYWLADKTASYLQPAPEPGAHPSGIPDCGGAVTNHRHVRCVAASRLRPGAVPTGDPAQARRSQTLADRRGDRRVR